MQKPEYANGFTFAMSEITGEFGLTFYADMPIFELENNSFDSATITSESEKIEVAKIVMTKYNAKLLSDKLSEILNVSSREE